MSPHKNSDNKSNANKGLAAVPEMGITSVYWHCTSMCSEGLHLCPSLWQFAYLSVIPLTECTLSSTCFGLHSIYGQSLHLPEHTQGEKISPYIQTEDLLFQLVSHLSAVHHYEEPASILNGGCPPGVYQRLLSGLTETISSPGWEGPSPSASPHKASASALIIIVAFHWNFSSLLMSS